ncbi:zinc finger protein 287-like [Manduca sexta]|uniref:Uncharacterized protein n=1 Tax=Manduca sexta TaxID=7130 RepID=A0A922CUT8_MANSE|nr:zinc finger protein 287-like [Manduca sexta]KAG6459157.1 hypothetical protein O3G_MSEX011235 [Manduca sexta]
METRSYGECRCCLAKGKHRDITKEYYVNGIREVIIDNFMECFNLFLSTNVQLSTLICSSCVLRLRDACSFRNLVVNTERKLLDALTDSEQKQTVFVNVAAGLASDDYNLHEEVDIKMEPVEEVKEELQDNEYYDIDVELDDADSIDYHIKDHARDKRNGRDSLVDGEAEILARFDPKSLRPLPTRLTLANTCPDYVKHLNLLKGTMVMPNMIKKLLKENEKKKLELSGNVYITEKVAQVINAATLIELSNMTPFKSRGRNGFLCFYCPNVFDKGSKLREHTLEHDKTETRKILKTYVTESLIVNADITNLKCTICDEALPSLGELRTHLIKHHKKEIYTEFTDRTIPFKLSDNNQFECQICACSFVTFGGIERHMNVHFRNYICKDCGTGFVTKARLKVHYYNSHVGGAFPCEMCGKTFGTQLKHKNHVDSVHKMVKRFKCNKCPERFTEYVYRQRHLVEVHGVPRISYKCNVCEKSFSRRYNLSTHMKRDHLEERDFQCDLCTYTCFSSKQLSMHMVKHNGDRIFECSVCKKSYARKKTLSEHMKIHNNDRRFSCAVCGQAFVQKCSLKGHMKTHHIEYSLS